MTSQNALDFYQHVFGGQKAIVTYKDAGAIQNHNEADQVMWGQVTAENGFVVMAYDVPSHMPWAAGEIPFYVSVRGDSESEIKGFWEKLSVGAEIIQALGATAWSSLYGKVKDRFGITWVLDVTMPYPEISAD